MKILKMISIEAVDQGWICKVFFKLVYVLSIRQPQRWCSHHRTWSVGRTLWHRTSLCQKQPANWINRIKSRKLSLIPSFVFFSAHSPFPFCAEQCAVHLCLCRTKETTACVRLVEINVQMSFIEETLSPWDKISKLALPQNKTETTVN